MLSPNWLGMTKTVVKIPSGGVRISKSMIENIRYISETVFTVAWDFDEGNAAPGFVENNL